MRIRQIMLTTAGMLLAFALSQCAPGAPSEEDIATAIAQTREIAELRAIATEAAAATDTPIPSETPTFTAVPSDTPLPSETPTLEPGMGIVPDYLGMHIDEAMDLLAEEGYNVYWVAVIDADEPEFTVIDIEPQAGAMIAKDDERLKLIVAVASFTPTPEPEEKSGTKTGDPCGGITYEGICDGNVCYWCEDDVLYYWDCSSCGGFCGYDPGYGYFTCFCP